MENELSDFGFEGGASLDDIPGFSPDIVQDRTFVGNLLLTPGRHLILHNASRASGFLARPEQRLVETLARNLMVSETRALEIRSGRLGSAFGAAVSHRNPFGRAETGRGAGRTTREAAGRRRAHAGGAGGAETAVALRRRMRHAGAVFVLGNRRFPFGHVDMLKGIRFLVEREKSAAENRKYTYIQRAALKLGVRRKLLTLSN
jgi:hypothetical protein